MPNRSTIAAIPLLPLFFVHAASVIPKKSITIDEPAMIAVGFAALRHRKRQYGPRHPAARESVERIAANFMDRKIPWSAEGWQEQTHWKFGNDFFAANAPPSYYRMIFFSRLQMVWIAWVFGWFIFKWSRRLFGETPRSFGTVALTIHAIFSLCLGQHWQVGVSLRPRGKECFIRLPTAHRIARERRPARQS